MPKKELVFTTGGYYLNSRDYSYTWEMGSGEIVAERKEKVREVRNFFVVGFYDELDFEEFERYCKEWELVEGEESAE